MEYLHLDDSGRRPMLFGSRGTQRKDFQRIRCFKNLLTQAVAYVKTQLQQWEP